MFRIGDIIKGKPGNRYGITNEFCTAEITDIGNKMMTVKIITHQMKKTEIGRYFLVKKDCSLFEIIGNCRNISIEVEW